MAVALDRPVLVVDDDESIRTLLSDVLGDEGYPVVCASDGKHAFGLLDCHPFALILLDLNMPRLDGWGFVRALKERGRAIPILLITARMNAEREAAALGVAGVIGKPFDLMQLLAAVADAYETGGR